MNTLNRYLDRVLVYANKPEAEATSVRQELKDHLLQKIEDLAAGGMPREEAVLEALRQHGSPKVVGYGLRGPFPWVDIRSHGTARGVIAIGPKAVGVFAFGGLAVGIFAVGGFSLGLFSAGGFALGLLMAWGGFATGGVVSGGMALGVVAVGGMAVGLVAAGGSALAEWVPQGWTQSGSSSHYTDANVPPILKSLEPLLNGAMQFTDHFVIIMPIFLMVLILINFIQHREINRVQSGDGWLIDD
jgi:hypothetical protein